jgi:hypothetical protein
VKLLRYLSGRALADEADRITEYTIAVDILGKSEDFKEGKDAVVRVEMHRLRKRLAEFYAEEGASHRVRIVIPPGNYAPQFLAADGFSAEPSEDPARPKTEIITATPASARRWTAKLRLQRRWTAVGALILAAALMPGYQVLRKGDRPLDMFWSPVLERSNTILFCVGNAAGGHLRTGPEDLSGRGPLTLKELHSAQSQTMLVADAVTLAKLASVVESMGRRVQVVSQSDATFGEMRNGPVVLVGLLNNDWTRRLVGQSRFSVERPGGGKVQIRDRNNPLNHDWFIDYYIPYLDVIKDYALVIRATDPKTEQMTVTAAGLSLFGTIAAGEFLTNPNEMQKLNAVAPKGWQHKNLEVVLSTEVIRGNPGPPSLVAAHFW